jgi:hypothetical protein
MKRGATMSAFDAAIVVLKRHAQYWSDIPEYADSDKAAIAVLEAAGRVDRAQTMRMLRKLVREFDSNMMGLTKEEILAISQIRALLEAIPNGGKE